MYYIGIIVALLKTLGCNLSPMETDSSSGIYIGGRDTSRNGISIYGTIWVNNPLTADYLIIWYTHENDDYMNTKLTQHIIKTTDWRKAVLGIMRAKNAYERTWKETISLK